MRFAHSIAVLASAIARPLAAQASEWTFAARASLSETWTDNINLAPDGFEESDRITGLRPGFSLGLEGRRAQLQLDYDLQALWFADNSDYDDVFHQLYGTGNFELAPETLFLDTFARYDQQNIDVSDRVAYDNIFRTGNRSDVAVFAASPCHVGRWGNWGESLVRYQYQATRFANTDDTTVDVQDADTNDILASLGSPAAATGFSWTTSGSYLRTEFEQAREFEFGRVALDVGMPVGLRTRLTGTVGRESDTDEDPAAGGRAPAAHPRSTPASFSRSGYRAAPPMNSSIPGSVRESMPKSAPTTMTSATRSAFTGLRSLMTGTSRDARHSAPTSTGNAGIFPTWSTRTTTWMLACA